MPDEPQLHAPRRFALIRAPRDFAAGASLVALALFALWAGGPLPVGTLRSVRPGMLPRAVAVLVLACGIALLALSLARRGAGFDRWSLRGPLFVSLGVVAFALTIRTAGLAVAGPLVVVVSGAASPEARPRELVAYAIVMTALCIGLFRYALHLPIPVLVVPGVLVVQRGAMEPLVHNLALGFSVALSAQNVGLALVGCLVGTLVGVLPGVGPIATITMLLR